MANAERITVPKGHDGPTVMRVCAGIISAGTLGLDTVASIISMTVSRAVEQVVLFRAGPYLDDARNAVCRTFLTDPQFQHCRHLLMIDSDIAFTPADIKTLVQAKKPIISGVYHNQWGSFLCPCVFDWCEDEDGKKGLVPIISWSDGWPMWPGSSEELDPVVEVTGVGAGFLLIERGVLEGLAAIHGEPLPYFAEEVRDGAHYGEDLTFCMRAQEAGFGVFVHRGVQVAHHKPIRLGGQQVV